MPGGRRSGRASSRRNGRQNGCRGVRPRARPLAPATQAKGIERRRRPCAAVRFCAPAFDRVGTHVFHSSAIVTLRRSFEAGLSLPHFVEGAVKERLHSLVARRLAELIEGSALLNELRQPGGNSHHLKDTDSAPVAEAPALQTSLRPVEGFTRRKPMLLGQLGSHLVGLFATGTEPANQALGLQHAERAGKQEGLDPHVLKAGDRREGVIGVDGREHEVPGEAQPAGRSRRFPGRGPRPP